jgi:hypothetical protein
MDSARNRDSLAAALLQMEGALDLLDQADAPGEIGSHLDLAICRLREALGHPAAEASQSPQAEPPKDTPALPISPAA